MAKSVYLDGTNMTNLPSRLHIVGASARAAATLSGVADLHTCDLFADHDLCQVANADKIPGTSFPHEFLRWAVSKGVAGACGHDPVRSASSWMYTGGLENHPGLVDAISDHHQLAGCSGEVLAAVRDPFRLAQFVADARIDGVRSPVISWDPETLFNLPQASRQSIRVLRKPLKSCGGLGIQKVEAGAEVDDDEAVVEVDDEAKFLEEPTLYYQQFVEGVPQAGLFLASDDDCRLLGVTRSWVNASGGDPFRYEGSLGPLRIDERNAADQNGNGDTWLRWLRLGQALSKQFGMRGLFGVDAIVTADYEIVPLEVNPRFTASMELLPLIEDRTVVEWHLATCRTGVLPDQQSCLAARFPETEQGRPGRPFVGKGILYAPASSELVGSIEWNDNLRQRLIEIATANDATLADLPVNGETICPGSPIMTVLTRGDDPEKIRTALSWSPGQLFDLIWQATVSS